MFTSISWMSLLFVLALAPLLIKKFMFKSEYDFPMSEVVLTTLICFFMVFICFQLGKTMESRDYLIRNGEVTGKVRNHGTRIGTESCNCNKNGCSVCTYTIYTVDWIAKSNVGEIKLDHTESRSSFIYATSDPQIYKNVVIGEPAAVTKPYVNYVKAIPESLFNNSSFKHHSYDKLIPEYPDNLHGKYKIKRVVKIGDVAINTNGWDEKLSVALKDWGFKRNANVVIVLTNEASDFATALSNKWINGRQNDIVVVFGLEKGTEKINWVKTFGWTNNEKFKLEIADELLKIKGDVKIEDVLEVLNNKMQIFIERNLEEDFDYLKDMVQPHPAWLFYTIVLTFAACAFALFFKRRHFK